MIVKLKRFLSGGIDWQTGDEGWVMVVCEAASPSSVEGRRVTLWLEPEDVTELVLALRDAAIHARSRPMT